MVAQRLGRRGGGEEGEARSARKRREKAKGEKKWREIGRAHV